MPDPAVEQPADDIGTVLRDLAADLEDVRTLARADGEVQRAVGIGDALNLLRSLIAQHPRRAGAVPDTGRPAGAARGSDPCGLCPHNRLWHNAYYTCGHPGCRCSGYSAAVPSSDPGPTHCQYCLGPITVDDRGLLAEHDNGEGVRCPGSPDDHFRYQPEATGQTSSSVSLDDLAATYEPVAEPATALSHLRQVAREHEAWADHGYVPVRLGWLRALGSPDAGQPADDSGAAATARALARHLASISEVLGLPEDAEAADATSRVRALVTGKAAAPSDGWASLPTPEDVAAEMSRQVAGSDTDGRRESLVATACRALDAIGTLREKGKGR